MKRQYYRNTRDLENSTFEYVETGCLFERKEDTMILVDEDRFVEFPYKKEDFEFAFEEDNTEDE